MSVSTLRAVIYARVSSRKQEEWGTIADQLRVLPAYVKAQGWQLVAPADTYVDDGRSAAPGKLEKRDGLARLIRDAKAGKFDVLVVVDVDRLSRTDRFTELGEIFGPFQDAGVAIYTPADGRRTYDDVQAEAQASARWLKKHRDRIMRGKDRAIAEGRKPAGPTPFGLRYSRADATWSIDPREAELVREAHRRSQAGEPCDAIARDYHERGEARPRSGRWSGSRIWHLLRSETYLGRWTANKRRKLVVAVPAIIDQATYDRTQAVLIAHGRRGLRRTRHVYLLEGMAICGACGAPIWIASPSSPTPRLKHPTPARYLCSHRRAPPFGAARCTLPIRRTADVDAEVWAALTAALSRDDLVAKAGALGGAQKKEAVLDRAAWQRDMDVGTQRIARLAKTEAEQLALHRRGLVSAAGLEVALRDLARERRQLERDVETARRALVAADRRQAHAAGLQEAVIAARAQLETASPEARQAVVRGLLEPGSVIIRADGAWRANLILPGAIVRLDVAADDEPLRIRLVARSVSRS